MLTPPLYAVREITRADPQLLWLYVIRSLLLCLLGPWFIVTLVPWYFKYRTLRYSFDDEGVGMSWGMLWRREIYLTYARIQDIHLSRGLFERWLGLATIAVQTASSGSGAEMQIVGLTDFDLIRDFLYSRMRGVEVTEGIDTADSTLSVLEELLTEVQRLRVQLSPSDDGVDANPSVPKR